MRFRRAVLACSIVCTLLLGSARARATPCSGPIDPCVNDDTLWPHAGPALFSAVGSADVVAANQMGFGIVTTYVSRPIVLRLVSPGADYNAVSDQVDGSFLWSYGIARRLELDLALALTLGQGGTGLAPVTGGAGLKDTATRDMRFGFTYAIVAHSTPGAAINSTMAPQASARDFGLVARFEVSAPTGDRGQFAGEHTGVFVPSVAGDYRIGRFFAGAELGGRLRPTAELLGARIGSQLVAAVGAGYDILPSGLLSVEIEAWALPTFVTPSEWQLSVRTAPLPRDLSFSLGGGGGIPWDGDVPVTTPRFRFTLGLRWAPESR